MNGNAWKTVKSYGIVMALAVVMAEIQSVDSKQPVEVKYV